MRKKKTDMSQGMLDLLILRSLGGGPLNGWDIMRRIGYLETLLRRNRDDSARRLITYEPTKGACDAEQIEDRAVGAAA